MGDYDTACSFSVIFFFFVMLSALIALIPWLYFLRCFANKAVCLADLQLHGDDIYFSLEEDPQSDIELEVGSNPPSLINSKVY